MSYQLAWEFYEAARTSVEGGLAGIRDEYLQSQGLRVSSEHLETTRARIDAVLTHVGLADVSQVRAEHVEGFLAYLRREKQLAPNTLNGYLIAVKGMFNWAARRGLIERNPLTSLRRVPVREIRRERRALTKDEIERLISAAYRGPILRALRMLRAGFLSEASYRKAKRTGERNALIYRILLYTGIRLNELRTLRWADVDLTHGIFIIRREKSKNGKPGQVYLPEWLVQDLRDWHSSQGFPLAQEFVVQVPGPMLRTFLADLELAKISRRDEREGQVDLHALRHTYATMLTEADVNLKHIQAQMRHREIKTTMEVYSKARKDFLKAAVAKLPRPMYESVVVDVQRSLYEGELSCFPGKESERRDGLLSGDLGHQVGRPGEPGTRTGPVSSVQR